MAAAVAAAGSRTAARASAIAIGALLAVPLLIGTRYDSYPLSTYPMFAGDRDRVASVSTVVAEGERLSSQVIGGTDEPMLAAESVVDAIRADATAALCAEVAARAASDHPGATLEVVTERYDTLAWFDDQRTPIERTVWATCEVPA